MTEAKPKPKRGRPPNLGVRERVRKLYEAGMSYAQIAAKLEMHEDTVRFHIRKLGIAPRSLRVFKANKVRVKNGVKVKECSICAEEKTLTEYRHPRHSVCAVCRRDEGWDK